MAGLESNIKESNYFFAGQDNPLNYTIYDSTYDPPDVEVVQDLTGFSLEWTMRGVATGSVFTTKTIGSGITVTSAVGGTLTVTIDDTDTDALNAIMATAGVTSLTYSYMLRRTDAGLESPLAHGYIVIHAAAARDV